MIIPRTSLQQRATTLATEDKSRIITIVAWATLAISVLVFLARQCIKFAMGRKKAGIDDLFILIATLFAVGLAVTMILLASNGLGVLEALTIRRADVLQKQYYASEFLYILTIGFAKLSLVSFFYSVHHQRGQRRAVLAIGIFVSAWTVASLAAVAFQCGLPKPWEVLTLHCYNMGVFWIVYCIIDMTSDVAIVMLSINLVAYLKVRTSRKIAVVACFAPRILVIGAAMTRLVFLYPISPHNNPSFNLWIPLVVTQIQACLSIVTACIPYVRAFFETAESSIRRLSMRSKHVVSDEESYGCCGLSRGSGRMRGHSTESTPFHLSTSARTSNASPRVPTPPPLSPLIAPLVTPPNTSADESRASNDRGLRLLIPNEEGPHDSGNDFTSPQTASSNALSPACQSPYPLLPSIALAPVRSSPTHTADEAKSSSAAGNETNAVPSPRQQQPQRFSLFPSQQQYSPVPQQRSRPLLMPSPIVENPRTHAIPLVLPNKTIPETQESTSNGPLHNPPMPQSRFSPRPSSELERVAHDDPLRMGAIAITSPTAVPAPIPAARPAGHATIRTETSSSSFYSQTPSATRGSTFSYPKSPPAYYVTTPPTAHPPILHQSNPYAYEAPLAPPRTPTSPQRNKRVLTPRNSSRRDPIPVSPVTPSTPRSPWREETGNSSWRTPRSPDGWEDAPPMPVVRDVRNSPRIVVQEPF